MKKLLLLSLVVINLPAAQMPSKSMASLEGLPAELKQLILLHTGINGGVLNIPALAQGITSLAATSKSLNAKINNPQNMLIILKALPRAGAVVLAQGLRNMPGIKSKEVQGWLKSFKLENGEELYEAVIANDPDTSIIKSFIENPNIDINWLDSIDQTALLGAIDKGHTAIVRLLLSAGANPNLESLNGSRCLFAASGRGYTEIVELLLAAGAKVNATSMKWFGDTPLIYAARKGHIKIVRLLLKAGADPLIRNKFKKTALDSARDFVRENPNRANEYDETIKLLEDAEKAQKEKATIA